MKAVRWTDKSPSSQAVPQGLGLGITRQLASDGANVVIADRQEDKAREEAEKLQGEGLTVRAVALDITDSAAVTSFFAELAAEEKRVDILVNNAGTGQQVAPIVELEDAEWHRVLDVTLTGAFYCCRAVGRIMEEQEAGCIVNISSINGQNPAALVAAYNVAKTGIISLTRTSGAWSWLRTACGSTPCVRGRCTRNSTSATWPSAASP